MSGKWLTHHAAQFHDQSILVIKKHASAIYGGFCVLSVRMRVNVTHNACVSRTCAGEGYQRSVLNGLIRRLATPRWGERPDGRGSRPRLGYNGCSDGEADA
jgi:hypothetical protein